MSEAEIRIRHNRLKLVLQALGSLAFIACAVPMVLEGKRASGSNFLLTLMFAVVDVAFFGFCFMFFMKRLFAGEAALIINSEGLDDRSSAAACGFVAWRDIQAAYVTQMGSQKFLSVIPKDLDAFLATQPEGRAKLMRANCHICGSPINISAGTLEVSLNRLVEMVNRYIAVGAAPANLLNPVESD